MKHQTTKPQTLLKNKIDRVQRMLSRKQKDELKALYRDFYTQPTSQKLAAFQDELEKKKKFFFENQAQQLEFKRLNVTPEQIDHFVEQVEARGVDELARNMESVSGAKDVAARAKNERSYYSMLRLVAQHQDKKDFNLYHQAVQLPLPPEPAVPPAVPPAVTPAVTSAAALAGPVGSPAPSPVGSPLKASTVPSSVAPPGAPTVPLEPAKLKCCRYYGEIASGVFDLHDDESFLTYFDGTPFLKVYRKESPETINQLEKSATVLKDFTSANAYDMFVSIFDRYNEFPYAVWLAKEKLYEIYSKKIDDISSALLLYLSLFQWNTISLLIRSRNLREEQEVELFKKINTDLGLNLSFTQETIREDCEQCIMNACYEDVAAYVKSAPPVDATPSAAPSTVTPSAPPPVPSAAPSAVAPKTFRCVDFYAEELGLNDVVEVYQKADWKRDVLSAITEEATRLQVQADLDEDEFDSLLFYLHDKKSTLLEALREFLNEKKCEVFIPLFDQMYKRPENNDITFAIALGLCCVCRTTKDAELTHFSSKNNEKMVALCSELKRRVGEKASSCRNIFNETSPIVISLFYAAQCYSHYVSLTEFRAILRGLSSRAAPSTAPPLVPPPAPPLVPPPAPSPAPSPAAATAPSASPPLASSTVVAKVPTEKLTCDLQYRDLMFHPSFSLTFYKMTKEDDPLSTSVRNLTETQRNMLKSIYGKPHHERVLRNLNVVAGSLTPTNWKKFTRETLHDSKHVRELNQIFDTVYGDSTDVTVAVLLCACKFNWEVAEECLEDWLKRQGSFPKVAQQQNIIAVHRDFMLKYGRMVGECISDKTKTTFSIKEILDNIHCFLTFVHCNEFCEILLQDRTSAPTSPPKAPTSPPKAPTSPPKAPTSLPEESTQVATKYLSDTLPNVGGNNCFLNAFLQMFSRLPEAEHFGDKKEFGKLFQSFLSQPSDTDGEGKRQILTDIDKFLKTKYPNMYLASKQQDPSEIFVLGLGELANVQQLFSFGFKKVFYRNSDLKDADCNQRAFAIALKQKSFQELNTALEEQFNRGSKVNMVKSKEHFASVRGVLTHEKKYDVRIEPMLSREVHVGTSKENVTLRALMEENEYSTLENSTSYKVDAEDNPVYRDGSLVYEVDCIHETYCCFSKYFFVNIKRAFGLSREGTTLKNSRKVLITENVTFNGQKFKLLGLLCHHGLSGSAGHWTATIRRGKDEFVIYNDNSPAIVFKNYDEYVERSGYCQEGNDTRTCMLYEKT